MKERETKDFFMAQVARSQPGNKLQASSYYKMLRGFFFPRISPELTTEPNRLKFCMVPS